jgi:peptide-methionine (R)-S-oxide reductase
LSDKITKTDSEWREKLTDEQFEICRKKGTEQAFSGKYWDCHDRGNYHCACCDTPLFSSIAKFDSGTGWPSYYQPITPENVATEQDTKFFMRRTEVLCRKCDSHLGHVFEDGPQPTGLRYCINSASLVMHKEKSD